MVVPVRYFSLFTKAFTPQKMYIDEVINSV
jgi:hypothetical protein